MHKTQALIKEIKNSSQGETESFAQCWIGLRISSIINLHLLWWVKSRDQKGQQDYMHREFSSLRPEEAKAHLECVYNTFRD